MQLLSDALRLDGGLDWTGLGAAMPVAPLGLEGSTPWRTCYKVTRSKEGKKERKTAQAAKSYPHQFWKRGHLGRKAPSPDKVLLQV